MAEESNSVFISNEGKRKLSYGQLSPPDHPGIKKLKGWLRKYSKKYGVLNTLRYDLSIKKQVRDYAVGYANTYEKDGRTYAQIEVEEPLNEILFFHELMHICIRSMERSWAFENFSDFSSLDITVNTKMALHQLFHHLEEWFIELFILREILEIRDDKKRLVKLLGDGLDEYVRQKNGGFENLKEDDFSNLSELFHSWRSGLYLLLINLCSYTALTVYSKNGCVPKDFVQAPIAGVPKQLHDLLLRYSDLEPLKSDDLYYKTLYAEFVNVIVKAQTGKNEPAVVVRGDKFHADLVFQPILQEAVAEFDKDTNFVEHLRTPMIEIIEKMARETFQKTGGRIINKIFCWGLVDAGLLDEGQYFLGHYLIPIFEEEFPRIAAKHNLTIEHADIELLVDEDQHANNRL